MSKTPAIFNPRIRRTATSSGIQLTYALQTDPAPLTASSSTTNAVDASIEVVVTNNTAAALAIAEIDITIGVGTDSNDLVTQTTANSGMTISGIAGFSPQVPGAVTQGTAMFSAVPTAAPVSLAAGASFVIAIFNLPINTSSGSTTITISESIGSTQPTPPTVTFQVTKFPYGFFLEDLVATTPNGSNFSPVAQVNHGTPVTLQWDGSQANPNDYIIFYSTNGGQATAIPTSANLWISPPLVSDTTFALTMSASTSQGGTVSETLGVTVSVAQPDLVVTTLTSNGTLAAKANATVAGTLTTTGTSTANSDLIVNGTATFNGAVNVDKGISITGQATAKNGLAVTGAALTAADGATISGTLTLPGIAEIFGPAVAVSLPTSGTPAVYQATSDGVLLINGNGSHRQPYPIFQVWVYTGSGPEFTSAAMAYVDHNGNQAIVLPPLTVPIKANASVSIIVLPGLPADYQSYCSFFPIGQAGTMTKLS